MAKNYGNLYSYKEKKHSPRGTTALLLGIVSLVVFIVLAVICTSWKEIQGMWIGAVGVSAFVAAFSGMLTGLASFRDRCLSYTISKAGTLLCGMMVAAWFLIYCVGLSK